MKELLKKIALVISILVSLLVLHNKVLAQEALTTEQWREDLNILATEMPTRHLDLFHTQSKESFEKAVQSLHANIPNMQSHEVIVELAKIANAVGDGHSGIRFGDRAINFKRVPLRLHWLDDGVFVKAAPKTLEEVIGAELVEVGKEPVATALQKLSPLIAKDNDQGLKFSLPILMTMPKVLHALKISISSSEATFTFLKNDRKITKTLEIQSKPAQSGEDNEWVDARDTSENPTPFWLRNTDKRFAYIFDDATKTAYIQINSIRNSDDESLPAFANRVFADIDTRETDRLVIDIRRNGGGNNYLTRPVIKEIIQRPNLERAGVLFCIIGARTFSAAQNFTNRLENWTHVTFVSEPTSQKVNLFGDNQRFQLPNSGITVRASYLWWQDMDPRDNRQWTAPDLYTPLSSEDYRNNIDPAMEAILNYKHARTADELLAIANEEGFDAAADHFIKKANSTLYRFKDFEDEINRAGYGKMAEEKLNDAITLFRLNVAAYPDSWNTYDSLGEGYMNQGNKELAIQYYNKSIEINPDNDNGREMLQRIAKM
ncbi:MAG: tetratricopeptide repeat protein [Calditrichota bacterium]